MNPPPVLPPDPATGTPADRRALLVIDVQQALCSGPYAAHDSLGLIERINAVAVRARAAGLPVFLVQHESADGLLARGSPGWQLAEGLVVAPTDQVVAKTTPDAFLRTTLLPALQAQGVTHLVICGLQSQFCVDTSTRRALALGYPVTLVADGHSTTDQGALSAAQISAHHTATLVGISSFGPRVTACLAADALC